MKYDIAFHIASTSSKSDHIPHIGNAGSVLHEGEGKRTGEIYDTPVNVLSDMYRRRERFIIRPLIC